MENKLFKNLTLSNIVLVPSAIFFLLFAFVAIEGMQMPGLCYGLVIIAWLIALACGVLYIIKAQLGKKGIAQSQKIDARKTRIMFLVYGIIVIVFMIFVGIIAILFTAGVQGIGILVTIMIVFAILTFIIGLVTLIIDSIVVNKWRKNKKEA